MICPHCGVGVKFEPERYEIFKSRGFDEDEIVYEVGSGNCPQCNGFVVILYSGKGAFTRHDGDYSYLAMDEVESETIIFPANISHSVPNEVPEKYKQDFIEAVQVFPISPKASAALSRRILQHILREEYKIKHRSLAQEIDDFIKNADVSSYVKDAVDAVRNIGNFAAHPLKDTNTGEIVEVESGEAEWLIDVLEALFDVTFVQPKKLEERKKQLNEKLKKIGKPPMKDS